MPLDYLTLPYLNQSLSSTYVGRYYSFPRVGLSDSPGALCQPLQVTLVQEPVERLHAIWMVVTTMRGPPWSRSVLYMRHHNQILFTRVARRHLFKPSSGDLSISDILDLPPAFNGSEPHRIEATGHVRTIRNQRRMSFVELGDGSTTRSLQAILDPPQAEKYAYNIAEFCTVQHKN